MHSSENSSVPSVASFGDTHRHVHECDECGLLSSLTLPVAGTDIVCARCDNILRRVHPHSIAHGLAWSLTALFFYLLTVTSPMLRVGIYGNYRSGSIESGAVMLDNQGFWLLSALVLFTTVLMPFFKIAGNLLVLINVRLGRKRRWVAVVYVMLKHLKPWVMIEVYLLGFLVAYSRLQLIASVHLAGAVIGLVGLMIAIIAMDASQDPEMIWKKIAPRRSVALHLHPSHLIACDVCAQVSPAQEGDGCPRCGEPLHHRKPNSLARAWALTIAAAVLYAPSNMFPIMNITKIGKTQSYTIYGGLMELAHVGLWPLAVLVFIASIAIPVFKLVVMVSLLVQTHRGATNALPNRTRLYRLVDFIGRWSMVDIFVVSILVALVHFGWLTQITANAGALYFASVVVLTLLAVHSFDPRLMWDAAQAVSEKRPSLSSNTPRFIA